MVEQRVDRVADEVHGRLEAGDQQQDAQRQQFVRAYLVALGRHHAADDVVGRFPAPQREQVPEQCGQLRVGRLQPLRV